MEMTPKNSTEEECGIGEGVRRDEVVASDKVKPLFTIVEPETASRSQIADRILSRILADLSVMRDIAVRASGASMRDEERASAQRDVEGLKGDISKLTKMLSKFTIDELGMTEAEYAESIALIDRSLEEAASVMKNPHSMRKVDFRPQTAGDEALSKWFGGIMGKDAPEEKER